MSKKIYRAAIIGSGARGSLFANYLNLREDTEITALCDPNPAKMEALAAKLKTSPNRYSSVEEMLAKEQLDAAVITSIDCCHEQNAIAALKNGVNILIDKPLATTVKGCRNIIDATKEYGKIAMMGFNLRHHPVLKKLKDIIDAGTLGKIFLIENREFYNNGRTYMSRWNRKYEYSGGLWIHKGSHDFDVFQWLLNYPKPVKVSAFANIAVLNPGGLPFKPEANKEPGPTCKECHYLKQCPDAYVINGPATITPDMAGKEHTNLCMYLSEKNVHDNGISIVEYDNGAKASHMECFVTSLTDRLYTVIGDKGQAEVSLHDRTILIRPRWTAETILHQIPETEGGHGGADPGLVEYFMQVLKGEQKLSSVLEHGLWSTAVGQAAEISSREERMVYINELMN